MTDTPQPLVTTGAEINSTSAWTWVVVYNDGSMFAEFMDDGDHGFLEVDQARVIAVTLVPLRENLSPLEVRIDPTKNQRAIFFSRHTIDKTGDTTMLIHCIGRQETVAGKNVSIYLFIDDSGTVLLTDDYKAV
jgi:hypothetical protein